MKESQLKELLESLTLEEKICQLVQLSGDFYAADAMAVGPQQKLGISEKVVDNAGSILNVLGADKIRRIQSEYLEKSRHKIPLLFMSDIIYGYRTIYPIPLGLGATWNPELVKECSRLTAKEACAAGAHVTFAPMVDLVRDARWGRCMESTGEDTYLNCQFAKAMVEGLQGELKPGEGIASCVKHFAAYGGAEAGREYNTVDMSERRLREEYLPSYRAAVDAGCEMVMTSFNTVDEIPATGNRWLMDQVLRKEWGFDGVIITDYAAIQEMTAHGVAADDREAARLAIEAGVDIDMKTPCYANQLKPLIEDGEISEELVDKAVWRILKLKNKLGLFEDPYRAASAEREKELLVCDRHRAQARKAAGEALVLLKNENHILPLKKKGQKIALVGPYSDSSNLIGLWAVHGKTEDVVTIKAAMEEVLEPGTLSCAQGCGMLEDYAFLGGFARAEKSGEKPLSKEQAEAELAKALEAVRNADVVVMTLGEHMMQSGEGGSRTDIRLPEIQRRFFDRITAEGKPVVLIVFNGRPLVLTEESQKAAAVLEAWYPGTEGGHAIADVLFGEVNPSGRLTMSFPRTVGQAPLYYNGFNTGRPVKTSIHSGRFMSKYLDCPNDPLYSFGYGLSYHETAYSDLTVSAASFTSGEKLTVSVNVKNTGVVAGLETVQLYLRDLVGSVVRPVKELKGFQKIWLEAGEKKTVSFTIGEELLKFHTKDMSFCAEPGKFQVFVGKNAEDVLEGEFEFQ